MKDTFKPRIDASTNSELPTLFRVASSCRSGRSSAVYVLQDGVATLLHRTEPRGVRRARAFAFRGVA